MYRSVHFEVARCQTRARGTEIVSWLLAEILEYLRRVARWMEGRAFFFKNMCVMIDRRVQSKSIRQLISPAH